jgi:hypothetical protein
MRLMTWRELSVRHSMLIYSGDELVTRFMTWQALSISPHHWHHGPARGRRALRSSRRHRGERMTLLLLRSGLHRRCHAGRQRVPETRSRPTASTAVAVGSLGLLLLLLKSKESCSPCQ